MYWPRTMSCGAALGAGPCGRPPLRHTHGATLLSLRAGRRGRAVWLTRRSGGTRMRQTARTGTHPDVQMRPRAVSSHASWTSCERATAISRSDRRPTLANDGRNEANAAIYASAPVQSHFTIDSCLAPGEVGAGRGSSMVCLKALCRRIDRRASGWLKPRAYIIPTGAGTGTVSRGLVWRRTPLTTTSRPREHATTCSISTPSSFWRSRCSFSCGLRSVLGQRTGRERPPYDPYSRPATRIRPRRATRSWRFPAGRRIRRKADRARRTGGALEGYRRARIQRWPPGSMPSPAKTRALIPSTSWPARAAAYEMIVTAYAEGDAGALKNSAGAGSLRRLRDGDP